MRIVHLTASTFFGGPERQMLGLAAALPVRVRTEFFCFAEKGRCSAFLTEIRQAGFAGTALENDTPRLRSAMTEITERLRTARADVLMCHGYKSNLLGRLAARRVGIRVIAISRGWTGESVKVRAYDALDRLCLRHMDHVVCVSEGQARKVRRARVPASRVSVIRNAARLHAFRDPDPVFRERLHGLFPGFAPGDRVVCAAGRLSPEKGFHVLIEAAALVARSEPRVRFVLFGEGMLRDSLQDRIRSLNLSERFVLAGFHPNLDKYLPWVDLQVLPSFTEGLPNVALEASAAGKPVVATRVGGNAEVVLDGRTGYLVPSGRPGPLAERIVQLCRDDARRLLMGRSARDHMNAAFTFESQAAAYEALLTEQVRRKAPLRRPHRSEVVCG